MTALRRLVWLLVSLAWLAALVTATCACQSRAAEPMSLTRSLTAANLDGLDGAAGALNTSPCQSLYLAAPVSFEPGSDAPFPAVAVVRFRRGDASDADVVHLASWDQPGSGGRLVDSTTATFGSEHTLTLRVAVPCDVLVQVDAGCGDVPPSALRYGPYSFNKAWIRQGPACRAVADEPSPTSNPTPSPSPTPRPTPTPRPWPSPWCPQ